MKDEIMRLSKPIVPEGEENTPRGKAVNIWIRGLALLLLIYGVTTVAATMLEMWVRTGDAGVAAIAGIKVYQAVAVVRDISDLIFWPWAAIGLVRCYTFYTVRDMIARAREKRQSKARK